MHQYSTDLVMAQTAFLVATAVDALRKTDILRGAALIVELCRVLNQKNRAIISIVACFRRFKMAAQYIPFFNLRIGKETIGRFGVGPVLTRKGDRSPNSIA